MTRNYYPTYTYLQTTGEAYVPSRVKMGHIIFGTLLTLFAAYEYNYAVRRSESYYKKVESLKA